MSELEIFENGLKSLNIQYTKDKCFDDHGNVCGYVIGRQNGDSKAFTYFDLKGQL